MSTVAGLFYRLRKAFYDFRWMIRSLSWIFVKVPPGKEALSNTSFTLGVVTYVDRYERFFQPLLKRLVALFPDTRILVAVNGYHDAAIQERYLEQISAFAAGFQQVTLITHREPQGLSRLWNELLRASEPATMLICNDDIRVSPGFRRELQASGALDQNIALLNRSWSHFVITRKTIMNIGWFDERFTGVGNEDEDYECRLVMAGVSVPTFKVRAIKNISFVTRNFSYSKDTGVINKKYVKANKLFFDTKWELSGSAREGFRYVAILSAWAKLKPGMEHPDFYQAPAGAAPFIKLPGNGC